MAGRGYASVQGRQMAAYGAPQAGMEKQLPFAASQPFPVDLPYAPPVLPAPRAGQIGTQNSYQMAPNYSLPSFSTEGGTINLNLLALPPAAEDEKRADGMIDMNAAMPSPQPVSFTSAPFEPLAVPQPAAPEQKIPTVVPPAYTMAPKAIPPSAPPAESSGKNVNNVLDDIFGQHPGKEPHLPPAEPPLPVQPPPLSNIPPTPAAPSIPCHACGTINQVTTNERPTIITCSSCGAQGFVV